MGRLGQSFVQREAVVVTVRRPQLVTSFRRPDGFKVSGAPARERMTITRGHGLGSVPFALVLLAVILLSAHELAVSLGFGWLAALAGTAIVLVPLGGFALVARTHVVIDADKLSLRGPRRTLVVQRQRIAAIETHEARTHYVCIRTTDGGTVELMSLLGRADCWWLQVQLEHALGLQRQGVATPRAYGSATGRSRATPRRSPPS
ncbi:MAG TPA: PH domain-containing protein [Kofleriaceae bacterium]